MTAEELMPTASAGIDPATFDQILEMDDDDEDREFSKGIVYDFFEQAKSTILAMDDAIEKRDLGELSSLGHFLKGSSATLGLILVKASCEKIQHLGHRMDETGTHEILDEDELLNKVKKELVNLRSAYARAELPLRNFYEPRA